MYVHTYCTWQLTTHTHTTHTHTHTTHTHTHTHIHTYTHTHTQRCSSHLKCLCFSLSFTGSSPVLSRTTVFRSVFQRLTLECLSSTSSGRFSIFGCPATAQSVKCHVTAQVSALYRRTDITNVHSICS